MAHKCAALLLMLALGAAAVQAQEKKDAPAAATAPKKEENFTDLAAILKGHPLARAILDAAEVTKPASHPEARYTFLLPTEAAIAAFLKEMNLSADDLKKRPQLAKRLVAQHLILRSNVRESEIFDKGNTRAAASLAGRGSNDLTFSRKAPGVGITVVDKQGNKANIDAKPLYLDANKTVHFIDKVLAGEDYFTSFESLCKLRADKVSAFCGALKTTGLASALSPKGGLDATVFVPNNAAITKAVAAAKPTTEALTNILKLHVVPGARELPKQWKAGESLPSLLAGQDLKVNYAATKARADGSKLRPDVAEAVVMSANGEATPVIKANVHVGKSIVQGIGAVLLPADKPAAATKPAAVATEAAAKKADEPKKASTGRKLLQGWDWALQGGGTTAEMDAASSAIANAVAGNESTYDATQKSLQGAQALSVPYAYNYVADGINPW